MTAKKASPIIVIALLCIVILTTVLFVEKTNVVSASKNEHTNLYKASYISGYWVRSIYSALVGSAGGNIILVNPTSNSFSNLTLAVQLDSSDVINPSLSLWNSNYELNSPNTYVQSEELWHDMPNFSTPITSINIGPNQKENISLSIPSSMWFPFSSHNLKIYVSQNSFGDIINGQLLIVPQTEAYLQIANLSAIESNAGTYHEYYNSTLKSDMVTVAYNPNFYQRYHNISQHEVYSEVFGMMRSSPLEDGQFDATYLNVTVLTTVLFLLTALRCSGKCYDGSHEMDWKPYVTM